MSGCFEVAVINFNERLVKDIFSVGVCSDYFEVDKPIVRRLNKIGFDNRNDVLVCYVDNIPLYLSEGWGFGTQCFQEDLIDLMGEYVKVTTFERPKDNTDLKPTTFLKRYLKEQGFKLSEKLDKKKSNK